MTKVGWSVDGLAIAAVVVGVIAVALVAAGVSLVVRLMTASVTAGIAAIGGHP